MKYSSYNTIMYSYSVSVILFISLCIIILHRSNRHFNILSIFKKKKPNEAIY